jgi:sporulation integral membrane protein YlbJ
VVLGFLGGYPVGARTALSLYEKGLCTKTEAERLLAFCNNSGPAFILGVVGAGIFSSSRVGLLLYLTHAAASLCVGVLFRFYKRGESRGENRAGPEFQAKRLSLAFTDSVKSALSSALNICAFVVFFTVVIQMLTVSGALPALARGLSALLSPFGMTQQWSQRLLTGVLEISSGVWTLAGEGTLAGRLPMAAFMLGWAGLSVHSQVLSFLGDSGLSPRTYLVGKLLHGGLSALLTCALVRLLPLDAQVGSYLTEQVESLAALDLSTALSVSTAAAWAVWLAFFAVAAAAIRGKTGGKKGEHGV